MLLVSFLTQTEIDCGYKMQQTSIQVSVARANNVVDLWCRIVMLCKVVSYDEFLQPNPESYMH